eukprot:Sspe_Gene.73543::Locus_44485_Transcript_1_1_Confidence_1.000_Length_534::g.73543::m.73543
MGGEKGFVDFPEDQPREFLCVVLTKYCSEMTFVCFVLFCGEGGKEGKTEEVSGPTYSGTAEKKRTKKTEKNHSSYVRPPPSKKTDIKLCSSSLSLLVAPLVLSLVGFSFPLCTYYVLCSGQ